MVKMWRRGSEERGVMIKGFYYGDAVRRKIYTFLFLILFCLGVKVSAEVYSFDHGIKVETAESMLEANLSSPFGYAEHKFYISNTSDTEHTVTIVIPADTESYYGRYQLVISRLSRSIVVSPHSKVSLILRQPSFDLAGNGGRVYIDGILSYNSYDSDKISVSSSDYSSYYLRPILYSPRTPPDFIAELKLILNPQTYGDKRKCGVISSLSELPEDALGYSKYSMIIFTASEFKRLKPAKQKALYDYVYSGGILGITGEMQVPESGYYLQGEEEKYYGLGQIIFLKKKLGKKLKREDDSKEDSGESGSESGDKTDNEMEMRYLKLDDFEKTANSNRHILRLNSMDYQALLKNFPVIDNYNIPVKSVILIILLFMIILFPVNLIYLIVRRKKIFFLITVPLISVIFAVLIMVTVLISDGVTPTIRSLTLTYLDQESKRAFSYGTIGVYSPVNLFHSLHFESDTLLSYVKGVRRGFLEMDQTDGQTLLSGWVKPRIPSYFNFYKLENRRERIIFYKENGDVYGVNGLSSDLKSITYVDRNGMMFRGNNIQSGQKFRLEPEETHVNFPERTLQKKFLSEPGNAFINKTIYAKKRKKSDTGYNFMVRNSYIAEIDGPSPFLEKYLDGDVIEDKSKAFVYGLNAFYAEKGGSAE
jgi:hypothetical protein